jgi:hypothetical protein
MSNHETHTHLLDVDELWVAEWAAEGIADLERYLARHAAFAEYLRTRPSVHCGDGDRPADA